MRTTCAISSTFLVLLTTLVVSCMPARCLGSDLRFYLYHDGTNAVLCVNGQRKSQEEMGAHFERLASYSKSVPIPVYVWPRVEMKDVWSTLRMMCKAGLTNVVIKSESEAFPPQVPSVRLRMEPPPESTIKYKGGQLVAEPDENRSHRGR